MNQKIKFIRENLNLTNKDISVFLNISSYKYAAFEQIGMDIPLRKSVKNWISAH